MGKSLFIRKTSNQSDKAFKLLILFESLAHWVCSVNETKATTAKIHTIVNVTNNSGNVNHFLFIIINLFLSS